MSQYSVEESLTKKYWQEIESHYNSKNRYYHNLSHIYNMLKRAKEKANKITDYDSLRFAIWYHDIIYRVTKSSNEQKSAKIADNRLKSFRFNENQLISVEKLIISTKNHQILLSENKDNDYLLDFDLSILGTDWNTYKNVLQNIRKEYAIYLDFIYNRGRKKVLLHFLERKTLYFTQDYQKRFENQA